MECLETKCKRLRKEIIQKIIVDKDTQNRVSFIYIKGDFYEL